LLWLLLLLLLSSRASGCGCFSLSVRSVSPRDIFYTVLIAFGLLHILQQRLERMQEHLNRGQNVGAAVANKRGGGVMGKVKLNTRKYERKSKRFVWPDALHRLFVASIFDVGVKNASPKALHTWMGDAANCAGLTTEHLKSHLQKYRLNYERSKAEFLAMYDQAINDSAMKSHSFNEDSKNKNHAGDSMKIFPISSPVPMLPLNTTRQETSFHESQKYLEMKRQLEIQSQKLKIQAETHQQLQSQIQQQHLLHIQIQGSLQKIQSLASEKEISSSANFVVPPDSYTSSPTWPTATYFTTGPEKDSRIQLNTDLDSKMRIEMQSQMNLHREMLLRKEMVSQYGGGDPALRDSRGRERSPLKLSHTTDIDTEKITDLPNPSSLLDVVDMKSWDKFGVDVDLPDDDIFSFLKG